MTKQNILFTSVLGPYAVDSDRTRLKNPMSLLSNQVTRGQGYYTVQMCSRTWSFDMFGANLDANVAIIDFPRTPQLTGALGAGAWDRVGISSIVPNLKSLVETYRVVRSVLPGVPIDIGGHIANDDNVVAEVITLMRELNPAETFSVWRPSFEEQALKHKPSHLNNQLKAEGSFGAGVTFVKRDGLEYYGQLKGVGLKDPETLFAPLVDASFGKRVFGIPVPGTSAGLIVPDVGCPLKCDFCSTSHKFGGRFVKFLRSAEDIMAVANAQADRGKPEMFVMSENFSLDTRRGLKLLELMEKQRRAHRYAVFSSANGLLKLGVENIVKLGYSFVWIGLEESSGTTYSKMHGIDLRTLVRDLQSNGVEVLGSTILGFEHQTMADLDREIEHALSYGCVYNQFMLYMPVPGTSFYSQMKERGKIKEGFSWPDMHGQKCQNWHHPRISDEALEERLDRAFAQDFERLGPSLYRMMKVHYDGYVNTRRLGHELVEMRRAQMKKSFASYIPILDATYRDLKSMGHAVAPDVRVLRDQLIAEVGMTGRLSALVGGPLVHAALRVEKFRFRRNEAARRAPDPRCHVTHWGEFTHVYPGTVPLPEPAPGVVAIARPAHAVVAPEVTGQPESASRPQVVHAAP